MVFLAALKQFWYFLTFAVALGVVFAAVLRLMRTPANQPLESPHRGITMHRLSFGGGFPGFAFAAGSSLIFLIALPQLWYFVAFAVGLGVVFAAILRIARD